MTEYLLVTIVFVLEMSLVMWFFSRVLDFRHGVGKLHAAIAVFITSACSIIIYSLNTVFVSARLPITSIRSFTNAGSVLVVLVVLFLGNTREKTTVFLLGILPVVSVEILLAYTTGGFYIEPPRYGFWTSFLMYIGGIFVIWLVFQILIRVRLRGGGESVSTRFWVFETVVLGVIFLIAYSIFLFFKELPNLEFMSLFTLPFFMLSLVVVLEIINYLNCRYYAKENDTNLIAMQNEMLERYVLQKQESDRVIRQLSHDLKHNLNRLKEQSGNSDSIAEYEDMLEMHSMLNVGDDIANAIINEKRLYAQRGGIEFKVDGGFSDGLTITRIDFCSLLGNLLDNALESAEQVEDESLRRVSLQIRRKGHQLLIFLENGYKVEPKLNGGVFISGKKNRGLHGVGTLSINNIVEKYDGVIENTFKDNIFKSSLMLRCYE